MACVEIARGTSTAATATVTATTAGADVTGGHIIVCTGENDNDAATATCADTDGNTFTRDDAVANGAANSTAIFSAPNGGTISAGHVFTVTFPVATNRKWIIVYHVDDLDATPFLDNGRGTGTSQAPAATMDGSVSEANTLTIGCGTYTSDGAVAWTPSGDDGDVIDTSSRAGLTSFRYRTATGTHSEGGTVTDTAAVWSFVVAAYKQAASGTAHTVNVDDTVSLSDAFPLTQGKGLADTLALTDAQAFERGLGLADTLALNDALAFIRELVFADTVGIADDVTPVNTPPGAAAIVPRRMLMGVGV